MPKYKTKHLKSYPCQKLDFDETKTNLLFNTKSSMSLSQNILKLKNKNKDPTCAEN